MAHIAASVRLDIALPIRSEDSRSPIALDDANDSASRLNFAGFPLGLRVHIHRLCLRILLLFVSHASSLVVLGIVISQSHCWSAIWSTKRNELRTILVQDLFSRCFPLILREDFDNHHVPIDRPVHRLSANQQDGFVQ